MNKKPILLRIFAIILICEPLIKILILHFQSDFSLIHIALRSLSLNPTNIFNFWILFPLAGLMLTKINYITFCAFIVIQIYSTIFHLGYEAYSWPYLSELPHFTSVLFLSMNILLTLYILLPRTRELFFNENLRWWERASRYSVNQPCLLTINGKEQKAKLDNISNSGAQISCENNLEVDQEVTISFELLGESYNIPAQIIREVYSDGSMKGHGVKFNFSNPLSSLRFKLILFRIDFYELLPKYR